MLTQAEYAKHAGISRPRVCLLVKSGMPLTSADEADSWRGSRSRKRGPAPPPAVPVQLPLAESLLSRPPEASAPLDPAKVSADNAEGAYERQRQIERAAFVLAVEALRIKSMDAGRLVAIHATAAANIVRSRQDVLDLAERESRLLGADWIRRTMLEHDGAVVALAKAMPRMLAGRISPHDPEHAEAELVRWVEEDFLRTLYATNPWTPAP